MKNLYKTLFTLFIGFTSSYALGQTSTDAALLVKQGVALNDSGKFDQAIDKYNEAIKANPSYQNAYYEKGYTLFTSGKGTEAIPILEKLLKMNPQSAGAYDMLGSIYDDQQQPDKAINLYKKGILADPSYQRLHYNLAISYYRQGKYELSKNSASDAIKLDPKHASSQRVYALAAYGQSKYGVSLLAWCSFLLLEPQSKRSPEAFKYVQALLNRGLKTTGPKSVTINVSTKDIESPDFIIPITVINATSGKKDLTRPDSLALQLKNVFEISGNFAGKKGDIFYKNFFSDYLMALAQSPNMPAFARLLSLGAYQDESLKWFKDHADQLQALYNWTDNTKREL